MRPADTARQCCSGSTGRVNCSSKVVKRRMSHQRVLAAQNHTADAYQPSAVITGCSSGIGQGAALMLAQQVGCIEAAAMCMHERTQLIALAVAVLSASRAGACLLVRDQNPACCSCRSCTLTSPQFHWMSPSEKADYSAQVQLDCVSRLCIFS